jgi:transcriptional regulator with XRE-family HTH domain
MTTTIERSMTLISPELCRAARALLGWKQSDLADKADVSIGTIRDFEADVRKLHKNNARAIRRAFQDAGVDFLEQLGVVSIKSLEENFKKDETFLGDDVRAKFLRFEIKRIFDEHAKRMVEDVRRYLAELPDGVPSEDFITRLEERKGFVEELARKRARDARTRSREDSEKHFADTLPDGDVPKPKPKPSR